MVIFIVGQQLGKSKFFPNAVWHLQSIVRGALRAYVHLKNRNPDDDWLDSEELESLLFDSQKCKETQKKLGLR